jgi:Arc/MetJ-type ribon-helix-helix transcriptional regulator
MMAKQQKAARRKSRGRPPGRLYRETIPVRLTPEAVFAVEKWARGTHTTRSEAIRQLVELGLANAHRAQVRTKRAVKASEMAGQEVDRLGDPSATDEERQLRKRRLIKGPKEFRDIRANRAKIKG